MKHFISSLSVLCANTPPCKGRVSSRKILSLLLILFLSIGNVWGAETDTYDFKTSGVTKVSGPNAGNMTSSSENVVLKSKTGNTTDTWTIIFTGSTAYGYGKNTGIYFGTSSYAPNAQMTSKSYNYVSQVDIVTTTSNTSYKIGVKVGGSSFGEKTFGSCTSQTQTFTSDATTGAITISVTSSNKKQVKIEKVIITYGSAPATPEPEPEKTATSLVWSQTEYAVTMGETPTFPTLTTTPADLAGVTYSSSNGTVATIAADGTITIKAAGETTIKASYAGNETYAAATDATYKLTVNKAPATPTDNVYVKVTSTEGITDGEYLIVYEDATSTPKAPVAFDGSLAPVKLDVASNNIEVSIASSTIAGNTDIDAATFTINTTAGTIQTKDGYYIGQTSNANGLATSTTTEYTNTISIENDGSATIISSGGAYLRYNSANDNLRFRYFKSSTYTAQKAIALYKKASKHTVTIADCTNGTVSATGVNNGDQVLSGTQITLSNTPETGYKLAAYDVYKTGDNTTKVTVTDGKFIMPEFDVTISATFELAKTLTSIEITTPATQTTFWQGEAFNSTGLKVTAHFDGAEDEDVTDKVTVNGSTVNAGTVAVEVSFTEGSTTKTVTYNITVKAIPNTKETAYTVADAFDIIDKLTTAEGVFIKGIVSQVDSYNETYKSITYWISADGTTTNQLQAYSGKGLESADFVDINGVSVEDQVIVCGDLKKHTDGTYEFNYNNYLVEHIKTTKADPELSYTTTEYNVNLGDAFTAPTLNNPHTLAVTYSSNNEDVATVAADGAVTIKAAGTVVITASFAGDEDYVAGSASYTIKVMGIASLPFAFDGKCADIATTAGMTHSGIDADDYASSPHLKINTTGDYLTIHFDSEPDKLTYDIKGNSFSGGTFTVQESADGETYTTIATYTELGEKVSEEKELESTSRYVKFIYTEKGNGNVALGNISITKPDTRKDAGLAWSKETVTLTVGDAFTAPTLSNPNSLAVSFESSNDEVATVTAEGVIALVDDAVGTATITASFLGDATYKPATATFVVIVNEYVEIVSGVWQLVTDAAALKAGDKVIVASAEAVDSKYYALSTTQNKNNRGQADVNKIEENVTFSTDVQVLTLEVGVEENTFAFNTGSGYLYAASSSSNHLKTQEDLDANGSWTISIDANTGVATVKAQGGNTHNLMQYNKSSKLFSSYDNPQQDIALYKKMPDYTRDVRQGYYGTICLPNGGQMVGASIFEIAYKDASKIYFDEIVSGKMDAGIPYIFLPSDGVDQIEVYYTDELNASAGSKNGLVGYYDNTDDMFNVPIGNYILLNNQYCKVVGTKAYIMQNYSYIVLGDVPGSAPAPAPGVRRVSMGVTGQNTATGVDQVQGDEVPTKMIINGQLFILRGEKMYDAQGKLVK